MSRNLIIKDIRTRQKKKRLDPTRPTAVWVGKDLFNGIPVTSLTVIFRTTGCRWNNCMMCGYVYDSAAEQPANSELIRQFDFAMDRISGLQDDAILLKIFTSGSFFDEKEVPVEARDEILGRIGGDDRIKKIIAETRPEFVTHEVLSDCIAKSGKRLEIAVGLETSSDTIRNDCINKGFTFYDFVEASKIAKAENATVKAYLLLKPPFLSERTAVLDMMRSVDETAPYADTISINLCNVQKGTLVNELFEHGDYRPPWLWSAATVLDECKKKHPELTLISDPVGAGSQRGPHNCGICDAGVADAIRRFSITQDRDIFKNINCDCRLLWEKIMDLEDFTFGSPIIALHQ